MSGLGSAEFENTLHGVFALQSVIESVLDKSSVGQRKLDLENGFGALEASSRFFTKEEDVSDGERMEFSDEVDPHNLLLEVGTNDRLVHTQENVVQYFERRTDDDG